MLCKSISANSDAEQLSLQDGVGARCQDHAVQMACEASLAQESHIQSEDLGEAIGHVQRPGLHDGVQGPC